jgi:RNA polymerase sigma-70 factor (ECF subfamily)
MARGDRAALAVLYQRHAPRLLALGRGILGDLAEAEDLLHDVFLEAWRHSADFSSERGTVATWLALRTRSRAIDRRRAAPRVKRTDIDHQELLEVSDPLADPSRIVDRGKLRPALLCMSAEERQVIALGYFEGLSSSEIAERVGAPIGTVKSRTRTALEKLRDWFATGGVV